LELVKRIARSLWVGLGGRGTPNRTVLGKKKKNNKKPRKSGRKRSKCEHLSSRVGNVKLARMKNNAWGV